MDFLRNTTGSRRPGGVPPERQAHLELGRLLVERLKARKLAWRSRSAPSAPFRGTVNLLPILCPPSEQAHAPDDPGCVERQMEGLLR